MEKKTLLKLLKNIALFLLGTILIVWAYHSNEQYKRSQGVDTSSGATQNMDKNKSL